MSASDRMQGDVERGMGEQDRMLRDDAGPPAAAPSPFLIQPVDPAEFEDDAPTGVYARVLAALPETSVKVRRGRRTRPRGTTIAMKRVTLADLADGAELYPPVELARPRTRAECGAEARPCPWVACKHHLYLDINPTTGSIKLNYPDREPWELEHSCALDVADTGAKTLDEIGEITNLTRERIRQVEMRGLIKLRVRRELR